MYSRAIAALIGLCILGTACQATSAAVQLPRELLILPGAINIEVATPRDAWQISYYAPGQPYAWYYALAQRLEMRGWTALDSWRPGKAASAYNPIVPIRFQQLYLGVMLEEVVLAPDEQFPQVAHITMRRQVRLPWGA